MMWLSTNGTQRIGGEKMSECMNLRGIVVSKYGTVAKFAQAIGWCGSKAGRIVRGEQEPNVSEIKDMVRILGLADPETVCSIFLA